MKRFGLRAASAWRSGFLPSRRSTCFFAWATACPTSMMHDGLLMPLFAGVILCLAGRNRIAWFFGLLPFIAIGEASYCLYLLHFNLWTLLHDSHFLEKSGLIVFDPWISYLLLIVAALLTKRLIERPGRNWITRRLQSGTCCAPDALNNGRSGRRRR